MDNNPAERIFDRPQGRLGLCHLALWVEDLSACVNFYTNLLGMEIEWQPDADNVYLTSSPFGKDNLALHRLIGQKIVKGRGAQSLDHFGFALQSPQAVDQWHEFLNLQGVLIHKPPKTHRDGSRSFYCADPAGHIIQMIYHQPLI